MVVSGILFSVMQPITDTVVFEDPAAILSRLATFDVGANIVVPIDPAYTQTEPNVIGDTHINVGKWFSSEEGEN